MSSLFGIGAGGETEFYPFEIDNSLRLNRGDSAHLERTPSSEGDRRTNTVSLWVKRSELGRTTRLFMATNNSSNARYTILEFNSTDTIRFYGGTEGTSALFNIQTNALFRDTSAWYHIVAVMDTTQSTSSDRFELYVNGIKQTSLMTTTYGSQNAQYAWNDDIVHYINKDGSSLGNNFSTYYVAEVNFIDGQALSADSFGQFKSGVWIPKDTSGLTFGTNGFRLQFGDSSAIGDDTSGNGNDFTESNFSATDQSIDTCTNNFATLNSLVKAPSSITFSEGNLKAVHPGSWTGVPATIGVQSGRWYCEVKATTGNSANAFTGICIEDVNFNDSTVYDETGLILYFVSGRKTVDGTDTESFFSSLATNDIVGVALDLDSGTKTVTFTKNGSASGSAVNLTSNFDNKFIFPVGIGNSSSATANWEFNFGSPSYSISSGNSDGNGYGNFEYAVPSGYYALNTKNLAEFG